MPLFKKYGCLDCPDKESSVGASDLVACPPSGNGEQESTYPLDAIAAQFKPQKPQEDYEHKNKSNHQVALTTDGRDS